MGQIPLKISNSLPLSITLHRFYLWLWSLSALSWLLPGREQTDGKCKNINITTLPSHLFIFNDLKAKGIYRIVCLILFIKPHHWNIVFFFFFGLRVGALHFHLQREFSPLVQRKLRPFKAVCSGVTAVFLRSYLHTFCMCLPGREDFLLPDPAGGTTWWGRLIFLLSGASRRECLRDSGNKNGSNKDGKCARRSESIFKLEWSLKRAGIIGQFYRSTWKK